MLIVGIIVCIKPALISGADGCYFVMWVNKDINGL